MSETEETAVAQASVEEAAPEAVEQDETPAEVEAVAEPPARAGVRQARVYVCERAHRTTSLWSTPTVCRAQVNRREECGRQLYPLGELPEQVQRALNPLKASKKGSRKG